MTDSTMLVWARDDINTVLRLPAVEECEITNHTLSGAIYRSLYWLKRLRGSDIDKLSEKRVIALNTKIVRFVIKHPTILLDMI